MLNAHADGDALVDSPDIQMPGPTDAQDESQGQQGLRRSARATRAPDNYGSKVTFDPESEEYNIPVKTGTTCLP